MESKARIYASDLKIMLSAVVLGLFALAVGQWGISLGIKKGEFGLFMLFLLYVPMLVALCGFRFSHPGIAIIMLAVVSASLSSEFKPIVDDIFGIVSILIISPAFVDSGLIRARIIVIPVLYFVGFTLFGYLRWQLGFVLFS